jgi:hypothetical protein
VYQAGGTSVVGPVDVGLAVGQKGFPGMKASLPN